MHHPIDIHVGKRLRQRRTMLGRSQTALGKAVGLTFQQIQKYERGTNRIGASRLYEFARVLEVPVSYFFDEFKPDEVGGKRKPRVPPRRSHGADLNVQPETLNLVRQYYKIGDADIRHRIRRFVQALAQTQRPPGTSEQSSRKTAKTSLP